jgi:hypothetical protein
MPAELVNIYFEKPKFRYTLAEQTLKIIIVGVFHQHGHKKVR